MLQGDGVYFKGTKSHGDSWSKMMSDSHFKGKVKDDIYGIVFTVADADIWVHIHDKKTGKKLDESTWVFFERDLIADKKVKKMGLTRDGYQKWQCSICGAIGTDLDAIIRGDCHKKEEG